MRIGELVLVRWGRDATQCAVVTGLASDGALHVRKWRPGKKRFTAPMKIPKGDVLGIPDASRLRRVHFPADVRAALEDRAHV